MKHVCGKGERMSENSMMNLDERIMTLNQEYAMNAMMFAEDKRTYTVCAICPGRLEMPVVWPSQFYKGQNLPFLLCAYV